MTRMTITVSFAFLRGRGYPLSELEGSIIFYTDYIINYILYRLYYILYIGSIVLYIYI